MSKNTFLYSVLFILTNVFTGMCQTHLDILLQQSDISGYILKNQGYHGIAISPGVDQKAISQTWSGTGFEQNIYIFYAVFPTVYDAYKGIVFYKGDNASPFYIGSGSGNILGDMSWFAGHDTISSQIILIGNIGIQYFSVPESNNIEFFRNLSNILCSKIEYNLDKAIKNLEDEKRISQIDSINFTKYIEGAVASNDMKDYTIFSRRDSKWFDDATFTFGRRVEWKNAKGGIIGIDIAEFDSEYYANKAKEHRMKEETSSNSHEKPSLSPFNIDSPSSVDSLISRWTSSMFRPIPISGISSKGRIAVHIYHSAPDSSDLVYFTNVVKKVSGGISFR